MKKIINKIIPLIKRTICLSAILLVAIMWTSSVKAYGDDIKITKDKAIKIANKEAKKLGYDIETMQIKATHYITPFNEYLSGSENEYDVERRNKLRNKRYWAIYYYHYNPEIVGGDLCIFINSSNGNVITNYRGK